MPSASWALQQALFSALSGDAALTALLGGANRIHDHVPHGAAFPYVVFGLLSSRDWSTGTDPGEEHTVVVHVWSQERGKRQVQEIAGAVRACLHDQPLALTGHRLVNLRQEFTEVRREADGVSTRGLVRFRAVTEPL